MNVLRISFGSPIRHVGLRSGMSVSDKVYQSLMRHVSLWWGMSVSDEACWSPMGFRWGMLVSNGFPMRHVGLQWVSNLACQSLMRHVSLRWDISNRIRDPTESDMPGWSPTCLICSRHAWSETVMSDRRLTYLIGDWHASSETDMPDRRPMTDMVDEAWCPMSQMRPVCIRWGMLVSDGFPICLR